MPPDLAELKGTAHLQLAGYYGMVKRLDECLGRLQDALRSLPGLEDNTILMQTCEYAPTTARPSCPLSVLYETCLLHVLVCHCFLHHAVQHSDPAASRSRCRVCMPAVTAVTSRRATASTSAPATRVPFGSQQRFPGARSQAGES